MSSLQVGEGFMPAQVLGPGINLYQPQGGDVLHDPDIVLQDPGCETVFLGRPLGECGGVTMANQVFQVLGATNEAVYANHAPTHGADANKEFEEQGARFDVPIGEVPVGSPFVISAHGAAPSVIKGAEDRGLNVFDVTCPLVERTHNPVRRAAEIEGGHGHVVYISFGKRDHPELVGTQGLAEELKVPFSVVSDTAEADELLAVLNEQAVSSRLVIVGQTTNNSDDANELAAYIQQNASNHGIKVGRDGSHDVCHTVRDRQRATRLIVARHHVATLVVVGSVESKNTKSLAIVGGQAAITAGRSLDIILTNGWQQLPEGILGLVGVVSGASTRRVNVEGVVERLAPINGVQMVGDDTDKGIVFSPIDKITRRLLVDATATK